MLLCFALDSGPEIVKGLRRLRSAAAELNHQSIMLAHSTSPYSMPSIRLVPNPGPSGPTHLLQKRYRRKYTQATPTELHTSPDQQKLTAREPKEDASFTALMITSCVSQDETISPVVYTEPQ